MIGIYPTATDMPNRKERNGKGTVAHRIREIRDRVTPAELSVVVYLLDNYPVGGLESVAELAMKANVSPPTVLRLVTKLGYCGYAAFQKALRDEVSARLLFPVDVYPEPEGETKRVGKPGSAVLQHAQTLLTEGLRNTFARLDEAELDRAVTLLADPGKRVVLLGGRFSRVLASHLGAYLDMLRANIRTVDMDPGSQIRTMIDIDENSVVLVFDYRRYQRASVKWGRDAKRRGARLILVTDPYLSPLASNADILMTTSADGVGPFDSMMHGFALVELLIALVAKRLGDAACSRLEEFEAMQMERED